MIALLGISVGALAAIALGVLVLGALARDLYRSHRRRVAAREQADLDARVEYFHAGYGTWDWRADDVDQVWPERRAA